MNQRLKPILFVGTGSDVGKSVINAAFCRIFLQDGYTPAPFKAQNMSLNSYASAEGLELGRAQAVQAEACRIPCVSAMNPILLKPTTHQQSQVILHGKPIGNQSAREYFMSTDRDYLFAEAMKAWKTLDDHYNPIVMEGAGSISEVNLRNRDITNMRVARKTQSPTILVADIDRGGVFGSVYGTVKLLPEEDRRLLKGIIINKFRGDISLFDEGRKILEKLTGIPVVGVIPYFTSIVIEQEDSVAIDRMRKNGHHGELNVAVVLLNHLSNFTDFDVLERTPGVNLFYTADPEELANADIILLPGSKNTMADLLFLRRQGLAKAIIKAAEAGKGVYGICGGYQMMGREIEDPDHVEGDIERVPGLGLLPVKTLLTPVKKTVQTRFSFRDQHSLCEGYEIHMGETRLLDGQALCHTTSGQDDGCLVSGKCWGTYLHGIFDNSVVLEDLLRENRFVTSIEPVDQNAFKEEQYDKLADHVRSHINMDYIYRLLREEEDKDGLN